MARKQTIHAKDVNIFVYPEGSTRNEEDLLCFTRDISISMDKDVIEVTTRCSDGWKEYIPSWKEFSISVGGLYASDQGGYERLREAFLGDDVLDFDIVLPDGLTYSGTIFVSSMPLELDYSDAVQFSADFQGTGALVISQDGTGAAYSGGTDVLGKVLDVQSKKTGGNK